jgi:hypothetical protein
MKNDGIELEIIGASAAFPLQRFWVEGQCKLPWRHRAAVNQR